LGALPPTGRHSLPVEPFVRYTNRVSVPLWFKGHELSRRAAEDRGKEDILLFDRVPKAPSWGLCPPPQYFGQHHDSSCSGTKGSHLAGYRRYPAGWLHHPAERQCPIKGHQRKPSSYLTSIWTLNCLAY